MEETLQLVLSYVRMVWRFHWIALACATSACTLGWTAVLLMPDVYEVQTKIFLDTRNMLRPLLKGLTVQSNLGTDAALMMRRTLLVRPNLEAVARKTDMDLKAKTPQEFDALLERLALNLKVTGTPKENIYVISYTHNDAKLATRVVEAILNIFVEKSLGDSRRDTSQTKSFLNKQIAEYESRLDSAEQRLKEFKQRNFGLLPQEGRGHMQRLKGTAQKIEQAELDLREAQMQRDELRAQLAGVDKLFDVQAPQALAPDAPPDPLDIRIAGLV